MKKTTVFLSICLAFLFFISASIESTIYEGSASVAGDGYLPESGLFAATDSFPVNTEIIITNLENERTVKVKVARGLDYPGLQAVLSRDAALTLGLNPKSIGRVSMSQAETASRLFTPGDPDYDPAAYAAANKLNPALFDFDEKKETAAAITSPPPYTESNSTDEDIRKQPALEKEAPQIAEPVQIKDEPQIAAIPEKPGTYESKDNTAALAQTPPPYINNHYEYNYYFEPAVPRSPVAPEPEINPQYILEPVRPQQPQPGGREYIVDQAYIIPPIRELPPKAAAPGPQLNPAEIIPPIRELPPKELNPASNPAEIIPPIRELPPKELNPAPNTAEMIPPIATAPLPPPFPALTPVPAPTTIPDAVPAPADNNNFSVPVISGLEKGKYYIQVVAGAEAEGIESEIRKIGRSLPLAVQRTGVENRIYRLLIGPVNLGESGALLERIKASYKDAFVRVGT
ncbi:MAG: hypothetical protein LBH43_21470 [Treponema sp.]|jgi:hypothetical protein|nr:hypothetical protein [Treponema sp.]